MNLPMYAIYDHVTQIYTRPMILNNDNEATRVFRDACINPELPMGAHQADYSMWHIGYYNDSTGLVEAVSPAIKIIQGPITPTIDKTTLKAVGEE